MKKQDQFCTLEQSQMLERLGIEGDPLWYHTYPTNKWIIEPDGYFNKEAEGIEYYPAWSVAELGVMLQSYDRIGHSFHSSISNKWAHTWSTFNGLQPIIGWSDTEAQARAAMLIHLLENNHITLEEVNTRIKNG